jgi:hypothetical protein
MVIFDKKHWTCDAFLKTMDLDHKKLKIIQYYPYKLYKWEGLTIDELHNDNDPLW